MADLNKDHRIVQEAGKIAATFLLVVVGLVALVAMFFLLRYFIGF